LSRSGQNQTADGGKPPSRLRRRHKTDSGDFAARSSKKRPVDAASHRQRFSHSPGLADVLAGAALAEVGASVHEIMAILGHVTEAQAMEYTRQANRKVMAVSAMAKWDGTNDDNRD
jgi:hypothetical protein